jgi:primosomal protein N' (replication factor Y)
MSSAFAQIALGLNFDKILTYSIPPDFASSVAAGKRVLVPLRQSTQVGFVVALTPTSEVPQTKEILDVLDPEPVIPPDLLRFTYWVAQYYFCPWGEVLAAALPAGLNPKVELWVHLSSPSSPESPTAPSGPAFKVLRILQENSPQKLSSLRRHIGTRSLMECLRRLEKAGAVILEEKIKAASRSPRGEKWLRLLPAALAVEEEIQKRRRKTPRQADLLQALLPGPLKLSAAAVSPSILKALKDERLVEIFHVSLAAVLPPAYPPPAALTPEQMEVLAALEEAIAARRFSPFLLHGVTASGKTEVYLRTMEKALGQGQSVLYLVPEITLTHQLISRIEGRRQEKIALWHSRLSATERYLSWRNILAGESRVVLGARSAIFAPLKNLGLIIVDEEHDEAYKQEESPRYNARDLALVRGRDAGATVILGSATPSLESYYNAQKGKYKLLTLSQRVEERPLPPITLLDRRGEEKKTPLSPILLARAREKIAQGEQVLFFLNRRGYSPYVLCTDCGKSLTCPFCDLALTYHLRGKSSLCHHCGYKTHLPEVCPQCNSYKLKPYGAGTQRLEEEVAKFFPAAKTARLDRDVAEKKGAQEQILQDWEKGILEVLVGTKMIAKGHDYPGVTLVGVLAADAALNLPDFRAAERTFQILTQVAGRAGRGELPGEVLLQTYNPEHYSLLAAQNHDYPSFYRQELARRQEHGYPPFSRMIRLIFSGPQEKPVADVAHQAQGVFTRQKISGLKVEGPAPAPYVRLRGKFRWHLLLRHTEAKELHKALTQGLEKLGRPTGNVTLAVDVDPVVVL